jgi:hypothetical protein
LRRTAAWAAACVALLGLTACGGSSAPGALDDPAPSGSPVGDLSRLLLTPQDVPGLTLGQASTASTTTTDAPPQLWLCKPPVKVGAHAVVGVIARPAKPGQAQVFELISVFDGAAAAEVAFAAAEASARGCPTFTNDTVSFKVVDVATPPVAGADATLQYRLVASDVVAGDVRTLVRKGRYLVLLSGFGAPPAGQTALEFQAEVATKALSHLS